MDGRIAVPLDWFPRQTHGTRRNGPIGASLAAPQVSTGPTMLRFHTPLIEPGGRANPSGSWRKAYEFATESSGPRGKADESAHRLAMGVSSSDPLTYLPAGILLFVTRLERSPAHDLHGGRQLWIHSGRYVPNRSSTHAEPAHVDPFKGLIADKSRCRLQ